MQKSKVNPTANWEIRVILHEFLEHIVYETERRNKSAFKILNGYFISKYEGAKALVPQDLARDYNNCRLSCLESFDPVKTDRAEALVADARKRLDEINKKYHFRQP